MPGPPGLSVPIVPGLAGPPDVPARLHTGQVPDLNPPSPPTAPAPPMPPVPPSPPANPISLAVSSPPSSTTSAVDARKNTTPPVAPSHGCAVTTPPVAIVSCDQFGTRMICTAPSYEFAIGVVSSCVDSVDITLTVSYCPAFAPFICMISTSSPIANPVELPTCSCVEPDSADIASVVRMSSVKIVVETTSEPSLPLPTFTGGPICPSVDESIDGAGASGRIFVSSRPIMYWQPLARSAKNMARIRNDLPP